MRYTGSSLSSIFLCFALNATAQNQHQTTNGACSPMVNSNAGQITIQCSGVSVQQGRDLVRLMNRIVQNQIDAKAVYQQLDHIQKGVDALDEHARPLSNVSPEVARLAVRGFSLFKEIDDAYYPWLRDVKSLGIVYVSDVAKNKQLDDVNLRDARSYQLSDLHHKIVAWRDEVLRADPVLAKSSPAPKEPQTCFDLIAWKRMISSLDVEFYRDKTGINADFSDLSGTATQRDEFLK